MKTSEKIRVVVTVLVAAGLFGVCFVLFNNEALPMWIRVVVAVLAVVNLASMIQFDQDLIKRGKK